MTIDCTNEVDLDPACGPSEPHRDLPLTFRWRTDTNAIAGLGLAPARSSRHDDARNGTIDNDEPKPG
jgi:hypothetical protein